MKKNARGLYQKQITITVNGHKKQKAFYGKTIAEVNKKLLDYQGETKKGRLFKTVAEEWWEEHQKTLESNSLKNYKPAVNRAVDEFLELPIKDISAQMINSYIVKFSKLNYAQKTVTTQLQIIRQILNYAVLNGEIEYNPALSVKIPRNLKKTKREMPTADELEKVKNSYGQPFGLFALFALYTGCRHGELLALQYKDIDFKNKQISINKSVYYIGNNPCIKQPKTAAGIRTVVLLEQLEQHISKGKPDDYIFNIEGNLITSRRFTTLWSNYCKALDISITPHQLRHAYATRLYELGIDEKSAQDLLGHADIATTRNIYTHISEEKRKVTAAQLANF